MWPMCSKVYALKPAKIGQNSTGKQGCIKRAAHLCLLGVGNTCTNLHRLQETCMPMQRCPWPPKAHTPSGGAIGGCLGHIGQKGIGEQPACHLQLHPHPHAPIGRRGLRSLTSTLANGPRVRTTLTICTQRSGAWQDGQRRAGGVHHEVLGYCKPWST